MSAILLALLVVAFVVVLTLVLTIGVRLISARSAARLAAYLAAVEDHLLEYIVEARDDPPPAPSGRRQQEMMRDRLVALSPSVKGDSHERLSGLFRLYGLVELTHADLSAPDPVTRVRAVEALAEMEVAEAVTWLVERLALDDALLVLASGRALAVLGAVQTMPQVLSGLVATGAEPGEVSEILLAFGAAGVPFLCERVQAGSVAERRLSAAALGEIRAFAAATALRAAMRDSDDEVVAAAVRALGQIGDGFTVSDLIELLRDDSRPWFVRVATARALAALDDPAAAPALVDALAEDQWDVRTAVARALCALRDAGLAAICAGLDGLDDAAVAHVAGTLDVAGRLSGVLRRAAGGDADLDRFIRRAAGAGVRARLEELAASESREAGYARRVLAELAPADPAATPGRVEAAA